MKANSPSITAEATLVFRAVEAQRPSGQRVANDGLAQHFLSPRSTVIGQTWIPEPIARWAYNLGFPGMQGYIIARTRYLDEYFQNCLDSGFEQAVILGAGYDSRAYRFKDLARRTRIFEVDHPATQEEKKRKLRSVLGGLPDHVTYVPIDFTREALEDRLFEHHYDPGRQTVFLWEGVTYYITADAVDRTLAFVARHSGRGSSIIFDYTYDSVVNGTCPRREARLWRKTMIPRGEPLLFGIEEGGIEAFLTGRGFQTPTDVSGNSLKQRYFIGRNRRRKVSPIFGIVHATVASERGDVAIDGG